MPNGQPGKRLPPEIREKALKLLETLTFDQVATRLGISKSALRNFKREAKANG